MQSREMAITDATAAIGGLDAEDGYDFDGMGKCTKIKGAYMGYQGRE